MLTVPTLKPGDQPFSPDLQEALGQNSGISEGVPDQDPQCLFDHAVVKDSITALHQEIDKNLDRLASYEGMAIANILPDQDRHSAEQIHQHKNNMKTPLQQHLFDQMTQELLVRTKQRAKALHLRKIRQYQAETIERQNRELAKRALSEENLFDDQIQTRYRDMILFNLETLHQDLPEKERGERLDDASRELYRKIMDSRLERDPDRLDAILSAPAVRRALGEEEAKNYDAKVARALRDLSVSRAAREWMDGDISPEEAEKRAKQWGEDETEILDRYRRFRADKNEKQALTHILAVQSAWAALQEGGYRHEASPAWAVRNHPSLYALLQGLLDSWLENGGQAPEPDYARFLAHMTNTNRQEMWAALAEEEGAHGFIRAMGGVEGWAFDCASRKLLAKSTVGDKALVRDLLFAREAFSRMAADSLVREGEENEFLTRVYHDRRCKASRLDCEALLFSELRDLLENTACIDGLKQ